MSRDELVAVQRALDTNAGLTEVQVLRLAIHRAAAHILEDPGWLATLSMTDRNFLLRIMEVGTVDACRPDHAVFH